MNRDTPTRSVFSALALSADSPRRWSSRTRTATATWWRPWVLVAGPQARWQSERHEVPAGHGAALRRRQRPCEPERRLFLARPGVAASLGAECLRGGHDGVRDSHREIDHDSAEHARPAPDDRPHRLRDVGLDLGPEWQPHGGQGTHQSVLNRRQYAATRDGPVR